ncbi:MAG: CDP-glycerol glycerophosphotransferase family protein [Gammaproteobacteria bacterium]
MSSSGPRRALGAGANVVVIFSLSGVSPAHAYLDPGSGSMLLYALAGMAAALAYTVRGLFHRVVNFLAGAGSRDIDSTGKELVFYSEGGHYWNVFSPVISALERKGAECAYFTSDESDEGLQYDSPCVSARYIGGEARSAAFLNRLSASLVVMTTPQLGIFRLKRSKDVRHYAHLVHAPTDALIYKRYAFDHFDSVLCSGSHQMKSIRELEAKRGVSEKKLFETGVTYYDTMLAKQQTIDVGEKTPGSTVLVAPTWGANGLLTRYGSACIRPLLDSGYKVLLRPHPQSYLSQPEMMKEIEDDLKGFHNLTIDRSPSGAPAMASSDMMMSDLSGIIFDYAFLFSKPVVVVACDVERGGFEAEYVEREIWEVQAREKIGRVINEDDFPLLPAIVDEMLLSFEATDIEEFRKRSLYNFGHAGETAANQLLEILNRG